MDYTKFLPLSSNSKKLPEPRLGGGGQNPLTERVLRIFKHKNFLSFQAHEPENKKAFTLAEVLITLAIIGIVAVITLQPLIRKNEERVLLTQFKSTYSLLQQTYTGIQGEYGDFNNWSSADEIYQMFSSRLKVSQTCYKTNGCFPKGPYKTFNPKDVNCAKKINVYSSKFPKIVLMNGAAIGFQSYNYIWVDINGNKKPNRIGYDLFLLSFSNKFPGKIVGAGDINWMKQIGLKICSKKAYDCNQWASGLSCGNYVVKYQNMDHLHREITWTEWMNIFK